MANQLYANVQDYEISWSSIKIIVNVDGGATLEATDCEGIKWDSKLDVSLSYGTGGGRPMKETEGKVSYSTSATLSKTGIKTLKQALGAVAPTRGNQVLYGTVRFSIQIQHSTVAAPSTVHETILKGCRFRGETEDNKEGTDALFIEVPLDPLEIVQVIDGQEYALI